MKHLKSIFAACIVFCALFAISAFTTQPLETKAKISTARQITGGNPHVNGGGTTIEGGAVSTFVFNAVELPDGSFNGHLNYKFRFADIDIRMDIDCFTINGNRATLSGMVTNVSGDVTSYPFIVVGAVASFTVQDNGQGKASSPDLISDLIFGGGCGSNWFTYLPISGNISIKE